MPEQTRKQNGPYDFLLLTGSFLLLFMFGLRTISSSAIWLHLAAGRNALVNGASAIDPFSFSLPAGTRWLQTTWLYDVMVYKLWQLGGSAMVVLLHALAVAGAYALLLRACRKYSGQLHQATALLIAAWLTAPLFTPRPLLFSLLFIGLFVNRLSQDRLGKANIILLAAAQLVWVNMHSTFILGIMLVAIRAWEAFGQGKKPGENSPSASPPIPYLLLTVLLAAVSLINPFGLKAFTKALTYVTQPDATVTIEWVSLFYRDFLPISTGFITTVTLILIAAVFIFYRRRLPYVPTFCAILSAFLLVRSNLTPEFCAALAFPFLAISLATVTSSGKDLAPPRAAPWIDRGLFTFTAVMILLGGFMVMTNRYYVSSGSASAFGLGVNTDVFPVGAVKHITENHELPERTLNIANDGGYMLWQRPNEKVFSDPRGELYGGLFFQTLAKGLLGNSRHWNELISTYDPEGVLLNAAWSGAGTVVYHLMARGNWVIAYFDGTSVLLVQKTAGNQPLMEDTDMQRKGVELIDASYQRYTRSLNNRFIRPPNPTRLIGAATVLQALGRHKESINILRALTEGTPRMTSAWINRGIAEVNLDISHEASQSLERALRMQPANPVALLWLSEAYRKQNRQSEAAMAIEQARKINPDIVEVFEQEQESMMFQAPEE